MTDGRSGHPVQLAVREEDGDPRVVDGDPPKPPDAPLQDKRWLFFRHQLIGIPLMLVIVVAAVLGLFGKSESTATVDDGVVGMTVRHVSTFRYKMIGPLEVTVENSSSEPLAGVTVRIDRSYLDEFSNVVLTPSPTSVSSQWVVFELGKVGPGESIAITGEIQAESFGRHRGEVRVGAEGVEGASSAVSTLAALTVR